MPTLSAMQWRYATKKFDATKQLGTKELEELLETVRLAPSSFGLQPYRVLTVTDPATRQQISDAAMGQPQIVAASHLLVFAAERQVGQPQVSAFIDRAAAARNLPRAQLAAREAQILGAVERLGDDGVLPWSQKQAYLAVGVLLTAAAIARIDACPMEGFDSHAVNRILDLDAQGLTATVIVTLGVRAGDDPVAALAKVRKTPEELFQRI